MSVVEKVIHLITCIFWRAMSVYRFRSIAKDVYRIPYQMRVVIRLKRMGSEIPLFWFIVREPTFLLKNMIMFVLFVHMYRPQNNHCILVRKLRFLHKREQISKDVEGTVP